MLRYHGPGSPGGVAHAYKVLERALPLLAPGARRSGASRRPHRLRRAGRARRLRARHARGDRGRYTVDPALARPERGRTLERFVFELGYRERAVTLSRARAACPTS